MKFWNYKGQQITLLPLTVQDSLPHQCRENILIEGKNVYNDNANKLEENHLSGNDETLLSPLSSLFYKAYNAVPDSEK